MPELAKETNMEHKPLTDLSFPQEKIDFLALSTVLGRTESQLLEALYRRYQKDRAKTYQLNHYWMIMDAYQWGMILNDVSPLKKKLAFFNLQMRGLVYACQPFDQDVSCREDLKTLYSFNFSIIDELFEDQEIIKSGQLVIHNDIEVDENDEICVDETLWQM